jgi:hypothetical protein
MSDDREPNERELRECDDALTESIEEIADHTAAYEADIAVRMKHCLAVLRLAGTPLDCQTGEALQRLGGAIQQVIHEACEEPA